MSGIKRAFRRRSKLLTIWSILGLIVLAASGNQYCQSHDAIFCSIISLEPTNLIRLVLLMFAIVLFLQALPGLIYKAEQGSFKDFPAEFDRQIVEIEGKIEHIFEDHLGEKLKRKVTDKYRNITGNQDTEGRFIHQRFLISSTDLKRGEKLLIEHNINFGKVRLKVGSKVLVKGVYIHPEKPGKNFYGRIHYTHEPKGFLQLKA